MIGAAELLFLFNFNSQQWEESWTHETWNGGLDFSWKSINVSTDLKHTRQDIVKDVYLFL